MWPGLYRGICSNAHDPMGFGRIKFVCPQVFGSDTAESDWAWPMVAPSEPVVTPPTGQGVWVAFEGGDETHPIWLGQWIGALGGSGDWNPGFANITDQAWGGADVNGDWTTAVAAANAYLSSLGEGILFFPAGSYTFGITNPATPGVQQPNHVKLLGAGRGISILNAGPAMTANLVQDWSWHDPSSNSLQPAIDHITVQHNDGTPPAVARVVTPFVGGVLTLDTVPVSFQIDILGNPVGVSTPGYVYAGGRLTKYTGFTTSPTPTLTGCTTVNGSTPGTVQINAEVRPYNLQGNCIAYSGNQVWIGRGVHAYNARGSNIIIQGGNATPGTVGHDIWPSRLQSPGRFNVEISQGVTDGRLGGFSMLGAPDGFAGILIAAGDWDITDFHHVAPNNADAPAVLVSCTGNVRINSFLSDTILCPQVYLDASGRFGPPGALHDCSISNVWWVDPGNPIPKTAPKVPLVLYRSINAQTMARGFLNNVSSRMTYTYGIQNGATATLANNGPLTLPASAIYIDNVFGFDIMSDQVSITDGTNTDTVSYTSLKKAAAYLSGGSSQTMSVGGTLQLGGGFSGLNAAGGVAYALDSSGYYKVYYSGITVGGLMTVTGWVTPAGVVNGPLDTVVLISGSNTSGTLFTQHSFQGCSGGTHTFVDGVAISQPSMAQGTISAFDVSGVLAISGMKGRALGLTGDTFAYPSSSWVFASRGGSNSAPAHANVGEWSTASITGLLPIQFQLPANPVAGQQSNRLTILASVFSAYYQIVTTDGTTITYRGVTYNGVGSPAWPVTHFAGGTYEFNWDPTASTWRMMKIGGPAWNVVEPPGATYTAIDEDEIWTAFAVTSPSAGVGVKFRVKNTSGSSIAVTFASGTINGSGSTFTVPAKGVCEFTSDGTNWQSMTPVGTSLPVLAQALGSPVTPLANGATNPIITQALTAGTWLVTATLSVDIATTNGALDAFLTYSGTGTLTGGSGEMRPSSVGVEVSLTITGVLVATGSGNLVLNAYPANTVGVVTVHASSTAGSNSPGVTNLVATQIA